MPISDEESVTLSKDKWRDQEFRNRTLLAWSGLARQKYEGGSESGIATTDLIFLVVALAGGGLLVAYLWKVHVRRRA
jgi:hypothetical protein